MTAVVYHWYFDGIQPVICAVGPAICALVRRDLRAHEPRARPRVTGGATRDHDGAALAVNRRRPIDIWLLPRPPLWHCLLTNRSASGRCRFRIGQDVRRALYKGDQSDCRRAIPSHRRDQQSYRLWPPTNIA